MINIAELLKNAPRGLKLYSPLFGEVEFDRIEYNRIIVRAKPDCDWFECFQLDGRYFSCRNSECLLFPSKERRTWEGWTYKCHYNISNFKPFDKVLVRAVNYDKWVASFFSNYRENRRRFECVGNAWNQCIPYNEDTKHLLGTTDPCPKEYINW